MQYFFEVRSIMIKRFFYYLLKNPIHLIEAIVFRLNVFLPDKIYLSLLYRCKFGKWIDWKNPKTFSEKIQWLKVFGPKSEYSKYVDKYSVKKIVAEKIGSQHVIPTIGVWDNVDDISLDVLPNKFALKTNHGCGDHIFCYNKSNFDIDAARRNLRPVLNQTYGSFLESHYSLIPPKIYAEELLEQKGTLQPFDYKFMCCDGEVRFILLATGRGSDSGTKFNAYDLSWKKLDYIIGPEKSYEDFPAPPVEDLSKMIHIAKKIAAHFVHVRVDLYDIDGKIYIGELTFTPEAGVMSYFNNKAVKAAGHLK